MKNKTMFTVAAFAAIAALSSCTTNVVPAAPAMSTQEATTSAQTNPYTGSTTYKKTTTTAY